MEQVTFRGSWWPQERQVIEQGLADITWENYPGLGVECFKGMTGEPFKALIGYRQGIRILPAKTEAYGLDELVQNIKSRLPVFG